MAASEDPFVEVGWSFVICARACNGCSQHSAARSHHDCNTGNILCTIAVSVQGEKLDINDNRQCILILKKRSHQDLFLSIKKSATTLLVTFTGCVLTRSTLSIFLVWHLLLSLQPVQTRLAVLIFCGGINHNSDRLSDLWNANTLVCCLHEPWTWRRAEFLWFNFKLVCFGLAPALLHMDTFLIALQRETLFCSLWCALSS